MRVRRRTFRQSWQRNHQPKHRFRPAADAGLGVSWLGVLCREDTDRRLTQHQHHQEPAGTACTGAVPLNIITRQRAMQTDVSARPNVRNSCVSLLCARCRQSWGRW